MSETVWAAQSSGSLLLRQNTYQREPYQRVSATCIRNVHTQCASESSKNAADACMAIASREIALVLVARQGCLSVQTRCLHGNVSRKIRLEQGSLEARIMSALDLRDISRVNHTPTANWSRSRYTVPKLVLDYKMQKTT